MELTTLMLAFAVCLVIYFWFRRPDPRLPPSPLPALPVVGHLLYLRQDARPLFKRWRKRCGDIFSLYMGGSLVVVLNGFDLIKEALVKKADVFSDRPPYFLNEVVGMNNTGIILSSDEVWKEQRSVGLSILREFGMGKNLMALKIEEEVGCYIKYLASLKGKPTDLRVMTNISTSNIICSVLIGHRFEYDDKEFQELLRKLVSTVGDQQNVSLINFIYWLKYIPGDFFNVKQLESNTRDVLDELMKFIKSKRKHDENSSEVDNLIDAYLLERKNKIQAGKPTSLDDKNLLKVMFDFFLAGTETTSTTICWCVLYLLNNPNIQEKVYREIKDEIGTDRPPNIHDKSLLTYLNAVIAETQRLASILPLSVTHMCSEEVTLRGYTIPKGAFILPNLDSVLHEKTTWGNDVMSFRPERFIDANGKLSIPEQFIPFSIGRRICLGEAMAKMELFLFLSRMLQTFQFLPESSDSVPSTEYNSGIIIAPKVYQVRIVERKEK